MIATIITFAEIELKSISVMVVAIALITGYWFSYDHYDC